MPTTTVDSPSVTASSNWLKRYYFLRFAVSVIWVVLALTIAKNAPVFGAVLLVVYPAWDAVANAIDARRSGGIGSSPTQMLNFIVSALTTLAVIIALGFSRNAVLVVFGVWASLSGVLQLATAVRRWKSYGAQWAMILSGAQSALAGVLFVRMAQGPDVTATATVAPYAGVGAFYFLLSAVWLTISDARRLRLAR